MSVAIEEYEIRPLRTLEDYKACVDLQEETWGVGFSERVSAAILQVSQHLGGVSAGAFDAAGRLMGFVFGMTGIDDQGLLHWSDMLAVRAEVRDSGLGRQLKVYQRDKVLARGVERMVWTWDPLQSRNGYLNLMKLGAVAREYRRDMYGQTDSVLHRGIGTDRLLALWLLGTERVRRRLAGHPDPDALQASDARAAVAPGGRTAAGDPRPGAVDTALDHPVVSVSVPADLDGLRKRDLPLAVEWRAATRESIEAYLARGYELRELIRDGDVSHYLLARRNES